MYFASEDIRKTAGSPIALCGALSLGSGLKKIHLIG
ncbi:Uncharacterised protein [Legionella israelensis]|nr:Uncharacterised protein [Legionella israelensis]